MSRRIVSALILVAAIATAIGAQGPAPSKSAPSKVEGPLVERVGDTGFIQIQAPSFTTLTPKQKELAYWLTQASIAIDPIIYDQLSRYGLREKRLLEGVMAHHDGVAPATFGEIREY